MIEHLKHLVDGEVFNGGKNIQFVDGDYFDSEFYKVINSGCTSWEDFIENLLTISFRISNGFATGFTFVIECTSSKKNGSNSGT